MTHQRLLIARYSYRKVWHNSSELCFRLMYHNNNHETNRRINIKEDYAGNYGSIDFSKCHHHTNTTYIYYYYYYYNVPDTTTGFDDIPSEEDVIPAGSKGDSSASCPSVAPLTGGGFLKVGNLRVTNSFPLDENTWRASAINEDPSGSGDGILTAFALCLVVSE